MNDNEIEHLAGADKEQGVLFRQLVENIKNVLFLMDVAATRMLYVSPSYEKIWGRSCESLYQYPRDWAEAAHADDKPRIAAEFFESPLQRDRILEYKITHSDGNIRWIRMQAYPVRDEMGDIYRVAIIAEDFTDQKKLEQEVVHAYKMEAIGTLAGGVAHEFNNIHQTVLMAAGIVKMAPGLDESVRSCAEEIENCVARAAKLTNRLSMFARRDHFTRPKIISLNDFIKQKCTLMRFVLGEQSRLELKLDPFLESIRIDPNNLRQILLNLTENSRDAMPEGGRVTIETGTAEFRPTQEYQCFNGRPGRYVVLSFSDTGIGMNDNVKSRLFEPFFTTKAHSKGMGLGLSAVYGIVTEQGGIICVDSDPTKGTTFQIYFPEVINAAEASSKQNEGESNNSARPASILLVDDEPALRKLMRRSLSELGYRVFEASTPEEALQIVTHERIDLLLTDIVMPLMNGRELAERIVSLCPDIRVLFMSGYSNENEFDQNDLTKHTPFISKPCDIMKLKRKISEALS